MLVGAWLPTDARADCAVSPVDGTVINCTDNNASGISVNNGSGPLRTLNVFDLTTNISPTTGTEGILFASDEPVRLFVDMGPWKIVTSGAAGVVGVTLGSGAVRISVDGGIETSGVFAPGILGETTSGDLSLQSFASILTTGDDSEGIRAESLSGAISVFSAGNISTLGANSHGIYATTGGIVAINASGNIRTTGDGAFGIFADGDSGAAIMSSANIRTIGDGAPGIAIFTVGDAAVMSSGNITTTGTASDGIAVHSINGMAVVVSTGAISATGLGSAGIYAAGNTGALVMNYGSVVGGPCCAGVMMDSNAFTQLLNWGTITAGLADYAIDVMSLSNAVENFGTVTGNVRLFDGVPMTGVGSFTNHAGALFNSGEEATALLVTNDGTIAPGGRGSVLTTMVSDDFVQGASGVYAVDLDPRASNPMYVNDYIVASNTATVAGAVDIHFLSLPLTAAETFTILTGMGGLSHGDVGLIAGPALHATLLYPNSNDMVLGIAVDFDVAGLNGNQGAIARYIDRIFGGGAGGVAPVLLGLLNVSDLEAYRDALDQLSPELYSDAQIAALYSNLAFANSLMSCKTNGTDTASIIREGQCLWAGASARFLDAGTTLQQIGFTEAAGLFTAGAQVALDDVWRLGVAAGYQSSSVETSTGATSEGSLGQAGIALKYNRGPLLLAGALTGGGGRYDTSRAMNFGGFTNIAEGNQDLGIFSGTLRAAYVLGSPQLYFKPSLDVSLAHFALGGFTEAGGGAALSVGDQGHTAFSLAPLVEAGTEFWLGNGTLVRPLIRGGAIWYDNADFALTASFADAPPGVAPFTIHSELDQVMGLVGAGIEIISGTDAAMRLSYDGQLGETTQIHAVGVKGSARF